MGESKHDPRRDVPAESGDSAGTPAPSATTRVAEGAGAPPEADGTKVNGAAEAESSTDEEPEKAEQPGEHAGENHERLLERDLEELTVKAQKADEYLELAQRTRADFENYRKRAARETAAAQERGVAKVVRELLPAVDNLDRAVAALGAASNGDELAAGVKLVHAEVIAAIARAGVERFRPEGERFDPELHEAVAQQPVEGAEPGTVVEVYQCGYRLGDFVIRPARVLVAG
jgi:molecular chaperone GrpE